MSNGAKNLLRSRVDRLRRALVLAGLARALCVALSGFCLAAALGVVPVLFLSESQAVFGLIGSLVAGGFAALTAGGWGWRTARPVRSRAETAAMLAGEDAKLRDLLVSGEELAAWGEVGTKERGASAGLVEAQVETALRALPERLPGHAPLPGLKLPLLGAFLCVALVALLFTAGPQAYRDSWTTLRTGGDNPLLEIGNLRLRYTPPAYTGLEPSEEVGADGDLEGYPGSRVTLEGQLSYEVDGGIWHGPSGLEIPLELEAQGQGGFRTFRVSWVLTEPGSYRMSFVKGKKPAPNDFGEHRIVLREDGTPAVELLAPEEDLEAMGTEAVEVRYRAEDDFGLERAELVLQGAEEVRLPLRTEKGREMGGTMTFLPAAYPQLGEGAYLRVDGWDNDTVSGPKTGSSRSVYIAFMSRGRMQAELEGLEERLVGAMLLYLADLLETPLPTAAEAEQLQAKGKDLLKLLDALLERAEQGQEAGLLGAAAVLKIEAGLRFNVEQYLAQGGPAVGSLVAELERDILFLDDLLRDLRMDQVLSMGGELEALQRDLFERLAQGDDIAELQQAVDLIEQMLAHMMDKLQKQTGELPDGFANADAVQEPPKDSLQQLLAELREALRQGDREKAAELAEKVMETLSNWMNELEQAAGDSLSAEMGPSMEKMQELAAEVSETMAEQERILDETRKLSEEQSREQAARIRAQLDEFIQRQEARLAEISRSSLGLERLVPRGAAHGSPGEETGGMERARKLMEARGRVNQGMRELRQTLRTELPRSSPVAEGLEEALTELGEEARALIGEDEPKQVQAADFSERGETAAREIVEDLERLLGGDLPLSEAGQQRFDALAAEQKGVGERIEQIAEGLVELEGQSPFVGPELGEMARKARSSSERAGEQLGGSDPGGAMVPQNETLEHLSELAQGMHQAQEQMMEQQQSAGHRGQGRGGQRGGQDVDRGRVEIPAEAETRQWRAFREEVLKAMREGNYPEEYEREVERYYERLIR